MKKILLILTTILLSGSAASMQTTEQNNDTSFTLPSAFSKSLHTIGISPDKVALYIAPAEGGHAIVDHRSMSMMNPASVMKVVTTYAALDLLGPTFTWNTSVATTGKINQGTLTGDLYLIGGADPALTLERFTDLLRLLRDHGIEKINGNLIIDRSIVKMSDKEEDNDPGKFDKDPLRPYNVIPDGLMVNYNSITLNIIPNPEERNIAIKLHTPIDKVRIENNVQGMLGSCRDWRQGIKVSTSSQIIGNKNQSQAADNTNNTDSSKNSNENLEAIINISGRFPYSCKDVFLYLSPLTSERYIDGIFRALWRELGGSFNGQVKAGVTPKWATPLISVSSPPLSEVIRDINKYSNNSMARLLYLSLSTGLQASMADSEARIRAWLKSKQIDDTLWFFENGSGLSRSERVNAQGLGILLQDAWRHPFMPEFAASLPLLGLDGTLRQRPVNQIIVGRARLKSGAIDGVRALAGYVMDQSNRWWVLVVLVNDPKTAAISMQESFASIVEWIWNLKR